MSQIDLCIIESNNVLKNFANLINNLSLTAYKNNIKWQSPQVDISDSNEICLIWYNQIYKNNCLYIFVNSDSFYYRKFTLEIEENIFKLDNDLTYLFKDILD